MKRCTHPYWFNLSTVGDETCLQVSDRFNTIINEIPDAERTTPSTVLLVGNKTKSAVLHQIFSIKRARLFRSRRSAGDLHLHIDPTTALTQRPLLVAEGAVTQSYSHDKVHQSDKCHVIRNHPLRDSSPSRPVSDVYYSLLYPFVDCLCLFSTDLGGFRQVACVLASWLEDPRRVAADIPQPRLLVISDKIPIGKRFEVEAKRALISMIAEETHVEVLSQFDSIEVVSISQAGRHSPVGRFCALKDRILRATDTVRQRREESRKLLSATHTSALFGSVCHHYCRRLNERFDVVRASRADNPVAADLAIHVGNVIRQVDNYDDLIKRAVPLIASSFLRDNYVADAHCK